MLVCKYLAPLQPPPNPFESRDTFVLDGRPLDAIPALVRFVSLVAFLPDMQAFIGDMGTARTSQSRARAHTWRCCLRVGNRTLAADLWCTSDEFLNTVGAGDWEEHATLLVNFLMWVDRRNGTDNWENYIVIGQGIPEGDTVYVLRRQRASDVALLINASTVCRWRRAAHLFAPRCCNVLTALLLRACVARARLPLLLQ